MNPEGALHALMAECQVRCRQALEHWLPLDDTHPAYLHRAMRYAALCGGKRIRPLLVYCSGATLRVPPERLDGPACAVELIHTYSLIHDDLPAMDDDDLRRGVPTCHRAFDEATAILAGDSLQSLAFHVLARDETMQVPPEVRLEMIDMLAVASGSRGMAGGQAIDLHVTGDRLSTAELEDLHIHKTGALIRVSAMLGALAAAESDTTQLRRLDHYAKCIGLAFQIRDDILDVEGSEENVGKKVGKDLARAKPTYPALLGMSAARLKAGELRDQAIDSLSGFDQRADPLRWLADYIVQRAC